MTPEKSETAAKLVAVASAFAFTFCCIPPTPTAQKCFVPVVFVFEARSFCLVPLSALELTEIHFPLPMSAVIKGVPHHTWPCALFLKCSNYSFIKILKVIFIVSNYILSIFVVFVFF